MKSISANWSVKRVIYLLMGIFFITASIKDQFWLMTVVGVYVISMALFNFGCAAGNCSLEPKAQKK